MPIRPCKIIGGGFFKSKGPGLALTLMEEYTDGGSIAALGQNGSDNSGHYSQSITGDGNPLGRVQFELDIVGSPTGTIRAHLMSHSGVFGTSSAPSTIPPTGALDTSTTVLDASTVTASRTYYNFDFGGTYTLVNATKYCIVCSYTDGPGGGNYIRMWHDLSSPTHEGNEARYTTSWLTYTDRDLNFRVYTLQ